MDLWKFFKAVNQCNGQESVRKREKEKKRGDHFIHSHSKAIRFCTGIIAILTLNQWIVTLTDCIQVTFTLCSLLPAVRNRLILFQLIQDKNIIWLFSPLPIPLASV